MKKVILLMMFALFFSGCSTRYISRDISFTKQEDRVSFPVPSADVEKMTSFMGAMNTGLWTEVVGTGGIWRVVGMTPEGETLYGYAYLDSLDFWGKAYMTIDFAYAKSKLKDVKFLYSNADGFIMFKMDGEPVKIKAEKKDGFAPFDPKKFDEDREYRRKVFNAGGMTLEEVDDYWRRYFSGKGRRASEDMTFVEELARKEYLRRLSSSGWRFYEMGDGSRRASYLPMDGFVTEAVKEDGSTFGGMLAKNSRVFLPGLLNPMALPVAGLSLAGDAVNAAVNKDLDGSSMRSKGERVELAGTFFFYESLMQKLLRERDAHIEALKYENFRLKQRGELSKK